jgi:hypothetical protein
VPAGASYVELMGVGDLEAAQASHVGRWLLAACADGDRLAGLAVEPDDLDATADRLGLAVTPGSRTRPDGGEITWRSAGMSVALSRSVPFFIAWDGVRGSEVTVADGAPALAITRVELGGDAEALTSWLGGVPEGLELVGGAPGVRRLALATAAGEVALDGEAG